jgi:hypothetical protein
VLPDARRPEAQNRGEPGERLLHPLRTPDSHTTK